jgi:major outer membrane protein
MVRKVCDYCLIFLCTAASGVLFAQDSGSSLPAAPQPFPQAAVGQQNPASSGNFRVPGTDSSKPQVGSSVSPPQPPTATSQVAPASSPQPYGSAQQSQTPPMPPAPPYTPFQSGGPLPPPAGSYQPAPVMPPPYNPYPAPVLEQPIRAEPGWYFGAELDILGPHISNRLNANVAATGFEPNLVAIGGAPLDWTGSPKFDLGYRFADGLGAVELSYRFIVTDGNVLLLGWDLDGSDAPMRSRLDMNLIDLDYVSRDISLARICDLRWRAGVRLASIYFDSQAEGFFIEQQVSNDFFGAGPHVGLDLWRRLGDTQLSLFGRVDSSVPIGQIHQSFSETFITQDGTLAGGATDIKETQAVPTLGIQFGLAWTPVWHGCISRYTLGYAFEQWWAVGDVGNSRANITTQGLFFRGEFNF